MKFYLALCLLLCSGCVDRMYNEKYTLYVDPRFTPSEQSDVISAAKMWEEEVHVVYKPVLVADMDCTKVQTSFNTCVRPSTLKYVHSVTDSNAIAVTMWAGMEHGNGEIYMAMDYFYENTPQRDTFMSVVVHEMGHGLGLQHVSDDKRDVMYPDNYAHQYITCVDVHKYADLRGLAIPCE
jgi:hypothetical protein